MTFPTPTTDLHATKAPPLEETLTPPGQEPPDPDAANFLPRDIDPFPLHCLPAAMRDVVETVCTARRVPPSLAGPVALVCHAASLGAGLTMPTNATPDRFTHGNLFAIVAARSGSGKGQTFDLLKAPLEKWERDKRTEWENVTKPAAAARLLLRKREAEALAKDREPPPDSEARLAAVLKEIEQTKAQLNPPRLIATDATSAALAGLIDAAFRHALASIASEPREAVRILTGLFRDGQSDDSLFLAGYSVETYVRDRRGANGTPESLNLKPCLCLCWSPQPDQLRQVLADPSLREGGFVPRCLPLDTGADLQEEPEHPTPLDRRALEAWESLLFSHLRQFRHRDEKQPAAVLTVAPAVFPIIREHNNRAMRLGKTGGRWPSLAPQLARVAENAWRLMANLHAAKHGPACVEEEVTEETARQAVELSEWFTRQCLALLFPELERADEKRVEELKEVVSRHESEGTPATLGTLRKRNGFEPVEVERLAQKFPAKLALVESQNPRGGPAAKVVSFVDSPSPKKPGAKWPKPD